LAIDTATKHLYERRDAIETDLLHRIETYRKQLQSWQHLSLIHLGKPAAGTRKKRARVADIADQTSQLIDSLAASGEPYVRVVGIIAPRTVGR
jgi:hypothetical protein